MQAMKARYCSWLVVGVSVGTALSAGGQTPVGALALDERQGDQYGWAVDGRSVRSADSGGDSELAIGAGRSVDGLS